MPVRAEGRGGGVIREMDLMGNLKAKESRGIQSLIRPIKLWMTTEIEVGQGKQRPVVQIHHW